MKNEPSKAFLKSDKNLDRWLHAQLSQMTAGISIASLRMAFDDWSTHLLHNPSEQMELAQKIFHSLLKLADYATHSSLAPCPPCIEPMLHDRRFSHEGWQSWPYNLISQSFLLAQQWWDEATIGVHGVSHHHENVVSFTVRQWLDMLSPSNFVWTNPEVLDRTLKTGGANLWHGLQNFVQDVQRLREQEPPSGTEKFQVGSNVAITPGKVVFRNRLMELIQYAPAGPQVYPEPVLVVPSWIMKYYILDLSPGNSLIRYLVEQGHTVFAISWKNPTSEDRDLGLDDYLDLGVMAAMQAVRTIVPKQNVHTVGYCLGGTLLSMAATAMGREGDKRMATMTLLAAQTDFTEPGELALFIDDSQVAYMEDIMWDKGFLDSTQMAGAFQWMSSNDLVWSRVLKNYLLGERSVSTDLTAWNADGTRLPYRMHSEYLHSLFLDNDLASGRYLVAGTPVALTDIRCPIYCLGTERDHVAPWRSVHKLHLLTDCELTFVLSSGGHNVGIVNPPGIPGRSHQVLMRKHDGKYIDPDTWVLVAPHFEDSWWPHWIGWLQARSGKPCPAPSMGSSKKGLPPICDAPGTYVLQR